MIYRVMRCIIGLALGFYFRRIERFRVERVPARGPVLLVSNHPNSLTDSFVIGASMPRKVNFVATVKLFRYRPVKWLLTRCGVIPINRVLDDAKAMRSVADTFQACFRALEAGEAVGIFPEGITYNDSQLKEVKSGAARMALELENRHGGKLGLQIQPAGLTYSAKEIYRSDALVNFGEPICAADFLEGYAERRKECITRLTAEIERRIQSLILRLPQLEHARIVAGVKGLYLERLSARGGTDYEPASRRIEELALTQRIADAVGYVCRTDPDRAAAFAARLDRYERWRTRWRISDEDLALFPEKRALAMQSFGWALLAFVAAPIALYGWAHRLVPFAIVRWARRRFCEPGKRQAQASTATIAAGIIAFGFCYAVFIFLFQHFFGWPASLWYALSLPVTSLAAHYYLRQARRLAASVRNTVVLARAPIAARRLLGLRAELIAEIERGFDQPESARQMERKA